MNKIISANINGFVFQIDELAYTKLKAYLDTIRKTISDSEVEQDIENRIAELFNARLSNGSAAIFDKDVDEVMQQIGRPEEFAAENTEEGTNGQSGPAAGDNNAFRSKRRLYRDSDDKVIGGVCSGIAAYFGLDPVVIRLAFAAAFFLFGSGIILYILLMVVIPKATTPAEKLEMRGEPVDYKNVSRTVEMEFKDAYQRYKPEVKTGFGRFVEIAVRIGMIMLLIFLVSIFIPGCFGIITGIGVASWSLPALSAYMFTSQNESLIILAGLVLFLMIPLFGVLYGILRFAFKVRPMNRLISISLSLLWFTGFCMLAWSTYNIGMQFSGKYSVTDSDTIQMPPANRTLILRSNPHGHETRIYRNAAENESASDIDISFGNEIGHIRNREDLKESIDEKIHENLSLNIVPGFGEKPVLRITRSSNGRNSTDARNNALNIRYHFELRDSVLYLDEAFSREQQMLWRNQKLRLTLELPEKYRLYIDPSCEPLLDLSGVFDDEVIGKYLKIDHRGIRVSD